MTISYRHWIALGALSCVALVGFEPFLQAVVAYSGGLAIAELPGPAPSIGRASRIDAGAFTTMDGLPDFSHAVSQLWNATDANWTMPQQPDIGMAAAVLAGFASVDGSNITGPSYTCQTGNCTWPLYTTLAVCSRCNDISTHIVKTIGKQTTDRIGWGDPSASNITIEIDVANGTYIKYSVPFLQTNLSNLVGRFGEGVDAVLTARAVANPGQTISFTNLQSMIISFSYLASDEGYRNGTGMWEDATVTAGECALYFCANLVDSEVVNGQLRETVLKSWAARTEGSFGLNAAQYDNIVDGDKIPRWIELVAAQDKAANYTLYWPYAAYLNRTDLQLFIPEDDAKTFIDPGPETPLRFNVSQTTIATTTDWFMNSFARRAVPMQNKQLVYPIRSYASVYEPQPLVIQSLGLSRNLSASFEAVAASMTNWMRDTSLQQSQPVLGTHWQWVVHIEVRWAFLSLPIAVLLGGIIFSLLSMWHTKQMSATPWMGSSLATLAHGLDDASRIRMRVADQEDRLADEARLLKVRLEHTSSGLQLVLQSEVAQPQ